MAVFGILINGIGWESAGGLTWVGGHTSAPVSLPERGRWPHTGSGAGLPNIAASLQNVDRTGTSAAGRNVAPVPDRQHERAAAWQRLRSQAARQAPLLSAPAPGSTGLCAGCRGPAPPGNLRCYLCDQFRQCLPGLLPDVVVPVAYAPKGGQHAANLWQYKSAGPAAAAAAAALRALLLVFLGDHRRCVWQSAGTAGPTHAAVVPSLRGRTGPHPLRALVARYLTLPWAHLSVTCHDGPALRDPDPSRFHSERIAGASVLLLEDTWTSGATAISAAAALRLAGARSVALVVLGRHLGAPQPGGDPFSPARMPFRPWLCAVHGPGSSQ